MMPILQIGPIVFPLSPMSLILSFWLGLLLTEKYAIQRGISENKMNKLIFTGIIAGLIASRVGYVLQFPHAFIQAPLSLFSPNPGLFDSFSALAAAVLGMLAYGQRARLSFWTTLDTLTPLLALLAVGLAVAHIASGEAFGSETRVPWAIELWGAKRHPAQFYELIVATLIVLLLGSKVKSEAMPGILFLNFVALTSSARLFLEAFRGDSSLIFGNLRSAQVVAWIVLATSLFSMEQIHKTEKEKESRNG